MTNIPEAGLALSAVHQYYELVDAGNVTELVRLFAPDACYHRPGYPPLVGRAALERFYRDERVIREGRHLLTMVVENGRDVAVHGEFTGVLRDDQRVSLRFADFFSLASDGYIARRDTFFFVPLV
jgi:ketosteroid isomerase-like protein